MCGPIGLYRKFFACRTDIPLKRPLRLYDDHHERQPRMKNLENSMGHSQAATEPAQPLPRITRPPVPALSKLYGLRQIAGKLSRRFKKLTGKPDNSPWVLRPRARSSQNTF